MSATGIATLNFGAAATDTSVAVASAGITGSSLVEAWIFPTATATNTVDNHWFESLQVIAGNVRAGVGFTIYGKCTNGLAHGAYTVGWVYN